MADIQIEVDVLTNVDQAISAMRRLTQEENARHRNATAQQDQRNAQDFRYQQAKKNKATPSQLGDLREKFADERAETIHQQRLGAIQRKVQANIAKARLQDGVKQRRDYERAMQQELRNTQQNQRNLEKQRSTLTLAKNSGARTLDDGTPVNAGMIMRSRESQKLFLGMQSAAAGAMLGTGLLNHNIQSIGFSLIFLRFSMVPVVALFAGLTVAAGILSKTLGFLRGSANDAGKAMEDFGQQQATFFQSAKIAQQLETEADQISKTYGIARDEAEKTAVSLQRAGLNQELYQKAVLNAAAGTGQNASDVAEDLRKIVEAQGGATQSMVDDFAQKYQLNLNDYSDSISLANALNARFAGGAENYANTQSGLIGRLKAEWTGFATQVGAVVGEVYKILIKPMIAFTQALGAGFGAAKNAAMADGSLQKSLGELEGSVTRLTPYLIKLGYILGTILFKAIMIAIHVMKTMIDAAISLWQKLKPILDWLINAVQWLKQVIDKFLAWLGVSDGLVLSLLALGAALLALWWFFTHESETEKLTNAIKDLDDQIKNAKQHSDDLKQSLGQLNDTKVQIKIDEQMPDESGGGSSTWGKLGGKIAGWIGNGISAGIGAALVGALLGADIGGFAGAIAFVVSGAFEAAGGAVGGAVMATGIGALVIAIFAIFVIAIAKPEWVGTIAGTIAALFINGLVLLPFMLESTIVGVVGDILGNLGRALGGVKEMVHGLETGDWYEAFHGLMMFVDGIFWASPLGWMTNLGKSIIDHIPGLGPALHLLHITLTSPFDIDLDIGGFLGTAYHTLAGWGDDAHTWVQNWGARFGTFFSDALDISPATNKLQTIWNSGVGDFIGSWDGGGVLGGIHTTLNTFATGFSNITTGILAPFMIAWTTLDTNVRDLLGSWDDYTGMIGWIHTVVDALKSGLDNFDPLYGLRWCVDMLSNGLQTLAGWFDTIIGKIPSIPSPPQWMLDALGAFKSSGQWVWDVATNSAPPGTGRGIPTVPNPGTPPPVIPGNLPSNDVGGTVPGLMGQRRLVWAKAGERFLGAPGPNADNRAAGLGGGMSLMINIDMRGAVVSGDAAMDQLANRVAGRINSSMRVNRGLTFHRA